MRKRAKVIILSAVILCLGFLILSYYESNDETPQVYVDYTEAADVDEPRSRAERKSEALESLNVPISLWGRVADQNGKLIDGAKVTLELQKGSGLLGMGTADRLSRITDHEGRFSVLNLRGFRLSLIDIEKDGHVMAARQIRNFNYDNPSPVRSGYDDPIDYVLISQNEEAEVVFKDYKILSKWDGKVMYLNFDSGVAENGAADLEIVATRVNRGEYRYDWELSVSSGKGKVLLAPVIGSPTVAPASGYRSEWSIGYRSEDPDYSGGFDRDSFVKLDDGRYARVNLNVYVDERRRNSNIFLRIFINESGGRVFEDGSTNSKF